AVERGRVDLASGVLAERGQVRDRERLLARARAKLAAARAQAPDRAAAVVAVDDDREDERPALRRRLVDRVARAALPDPPAVVVQSAPLPRRADVDLLPVVLADVPDVEVLRQPVERKAPGVAQAVTGDLPARAALVHVDAQHLAEPGAEVLRVVVRVAARAAVAGARVEQAVRAELQLTA